MRGRLGSLVVVVVTADQAQRGGVPLFGERLQQKHRRQQGRSVRLLLRKPWPLAPHVVAVNRFGPRLPPLRHGRLVGGDSDGVAPRHAA